MQDGTPTQCTNAVLAFLNEKFLGWVLSWRTANPRSAHSMNFNLLDFYFWVSAQNRDFLGKTLLDRHTAAMGEKFRQKAPANRQSVELARMSSRSRRSAWKWPFSKEWWLYIIVYSHPIPNSHTTVALVMQPPRSNRHTSYCQPPPPTLSYCHNPNSALSTLLLPPPIPYCSNLNSAPSTQLPHHISSFRPINPAPHPTSSSLPILGTQKPRRLRYQSRH